MANPTVVQGFRDVQTLATETRRTRDVTPTLIQLEPNAGPLVTLLMKLRKKAATDPKVEWFEDQLLPRFDVLGAQLNAGDTTMTVTNYKFFRAQDLVCVNGQEIVLVSATPTTTTVTITRAYGEIAAKQALNGATIQILSNTNQEGALSRSLLSTQRVPVYNYCQIIRDPFGYTNTEMATDSFAGKDYVDEQAKQLIEHKKHIEYSLLFGQRYEDTTGTHPQRTTRGIYNWIATNVQDMSGGMTEIVLDGFLRVLGRYGNERKEKIVFASPIFMQAINQFAKSKLRTFNGESTYGITLTKYEAAGRTILLHEHNLMTNDPNLNDFSNFAGMAFFVDIKDLVLRYVKGRMTVFNSNIQANDADEREDEYLSEVGLELHQERFHGKAIGVNA